MPLSALVSYIESKHEHEISVKIAEMKRDAYMMDALYSLNLANHKNNVLVLPRWNEFITDSKQEQKQSEHEDYTDQDVIDMLLGKGKLA
jgi:secreted Zn-dependent insulinase-like peptidase